MIGCNQQTSLLHNNNVEKINKILGKGWLCLHIRSVLSIAIFQLWQVDKN